MVNTVSWYKSLLHVTMKLAGLKAKEVEIEPGTVIHLWVPSKKSNKKPIVVLIHGFAGDGILNWQFQILSLRKKYNLYVPDVIFFGKSHTNTSERTTRFQADCLAKALKMVGVEEKCVVVGFSYGGFMGFQMAEHHPELVGSLVVVNSVLALSESITRKALKRIGFSSWTEYLMPSSVEGVKVMLDLGSYHLPKMPNFFYRHNLEIMFSNRKERVELLEALVVKDEDVTNHQFLQTIHLIWGGEDKIFDMEVANNLKERLGGKTELYIVEEAGHLVQLERPCVFNRYLKQVLKSLASEDKTSSSNTI